MKEFKIINFFHLRTPRKRFQLGLLPKLEAFKKTKNIGKIS